MNSFVAFFMLPAALLAGWGAACWAPAAAVTVGLPSIQALKVPLNPEALPPVSRRDPAAVDFRYLMPLDLTPAPAAVAVAVAGAQAPPLIVSAIFIDGERRVTQIGSQTYQKGDRLAGYRVQRIESMRVLLVEPSGAERWLEMAKGY